MAYTHNDINPFISYDKEQSLMVGRNGEYTIGFEMELPPIFTIHEERYVNLMNKFTQGVRILPNYTRIHRQDFIGSEDFKFNSNTKEMNFFDSEYIRTFSNIPMAHQSSYIYFTLIPKVFNNLSIATNSVVNRKGSVKIESKDISEFIERVEQFIAIMRSEVNQEEEGQPALINFKRLPPERFLNSVSSPSGDGVLAKHLFLQDHIYGDVTYNPQTSELKVGDKIVDIYTISSLNNIPMSIDSNIEYEAYKLPTSWGAYISPLIRFPHIVNTYILKGDPEKEKASLESKQNILRSFSTFARSNMIAEEEIDRFLQIAEQEKVSIIDAHVNIILWDKSSRDLTIKRQSINTTLTQIGCINPKVESYNKLNLFIASLPGNSINIFDEYRFKTFDILGSMLCNYVSLQKSTANKGLRVVDRLSKSTINIDIDEPYTKYDFNKNMFVLGGSGSGKSFAMNYYINHELNDGAHVVIVDIGRSYEGLSDVHNGKWYEFSDDSPLSFNPFILSEFDWSNIDNVLTIEKNLALSGIIKILWQGDEYNFSQIETTIINELITEYYRDTTIEYRNFNSFYEFAKKHIFNENIGFNKEEFFANLNPYYKGGRYQFLLNAENNTFLVDEKLIIFELDNIRNDNQLLAITTTVIMDIFRTKMKHLDGKKIIMFEEAWAALRNNEMSLYINELARTARKFSGKLIIVTQQPKDITNPENHALIGNCSEKILLDLSNFKLNFNEIQEALGLTDFHKKQIISINRGKEMGNRSKEFFIGFQYGKSLVVQLAVSRAESLLYTTKQEEKKGIKLVASKFELSYTKAIEYIMGFLINDIDNLTKRTNCTFLDAVKAIIQ